MSDEIGPTLNQMTIAEGDFVDRCHFSPTGFAFWKRVECKFGMTTLCTCEEAPRPADWKDEDDE